MIYANLHFQERETDVKCLKNDNLSIHLLHTPMKSETEEFLRAAPRRQLLRVDLYTHNE